MNARVRLNWSENETLPSVYDGWTIEIFGIGKEVDLKIKNYVWTGCAPFMSKKDISGKSRVFGTGPEMWILLPDREPTFRKENGAKRHLPPMIFVSHVLEELYQFGYKVVVSNSEICDTKMNQKVIIEYALSK